MKRYVLPSLMLAVSLASTGCVTIPGKNLPRYTGKDLHQGPMLQGIDYSVAEESSNRKHLRDWTLHTDRVRNVLDSNRVFECAENAIGKHPYHVHFQFWREPANPLEILSGIICGYSYMIIPGAAKEDYVLTVTVTSGDTIVGQYQYNDSEFVIAGLVTIPFVPLAAILNQRHDVRDNMIRNFLVDVKRDGIVVAANHELDAPLVAKRAVGKPPNREPRAAEPTAN